MYQAVGEVTVKQLAACRQLLKHSDFITADPKIACYQTWYLPPEPIQAIFPDYDLIQQFFLNIPAGGWVHRHTDRRKGISYHIPITTNPDAICRCYPKGQRDEYHLEVGKIYRVDRTIEHDSVNLGTTDRIHLILEVPCQNPNSHKP